MNKNRKNYLDYADRLIIADASPLINLNNLNKMDYLKTLFSEIYTTETVKNECNFKLPEWIKIEEPQSVTKKLFNKNEGIELIKTLENNRFKLKKNDIDLIFGSSINNHLDKGIGR